MCASTFGRRRQPGCICILRMLSQSVNFSLSPHTAATSQGEAHVLLGHCNFTNKNGPYLQKDEVSNFTPP